jgi:hypothetical protein
MLTPVVGMNKENQTIFERVPIHLIIPHLSLQKEGGNKSEDIDLTKIHLVIKSLWN